MTRAGADLLPIQKEHGYVEACVDAMLVRNLAKGQRINFADVQKWRVNHLAKFIEGEPPPLAVSVANELAKLAKASGRPALAIPAKRVAADIFYTLTTRKSALTGSFSRHPKNPPQKYQSRNLRSDAARQAAADLEAAAGVRKRPSTDPHVANVRIMCNALYKTKESFNCYLTPSQAIQLAMGLLKKSQVIIDNQMEHKAVQLWNEGEANESLHVGLIDARKGPRRKKRGSSGE